MRKLLTILALAVLLPAAPARADETCFAPMKDWQPREAVLKFARDKGWTVRRLRIDDGCYVIRGTDAKGRAIEVTLHPATLAIVSSEDDHDEDD